MLKHKKNAIDYVKLGIMTVSSTRTLDTDKSGNWMKKVAEREGHKVVFHDVVPDEQEKIVKGVLGVLSVWAPQVLILTGGTGVTRDDVTIEAVKPLFEKELTAFGPIFAQRSYDEIDSAAFLSRATAGIMRNAAVFCIPGSLGACKLACRELIFPELGHLASHLTGPRDL